MTPENVKDVVELLKLSCELGGFPILNAKFGLDDFGEDKESLVSLSRL